MNLVEIVARITTPKYRPLLFTIVLPAAVVFLGAEASTTATPAWVAGAEAVAKLITAVAACAVFVTAFVAFWQYKSQQETAAIQNRIALASSFSDLLARADGRINTVLSDAAITKLFETDLLKQKTQPDEIRKALAAAATIGIGAGDAAQAAAIECVIYFGSQYEMLNAAASQGLTRVQKYSEKHREQANNGIEKLTQASGKWGRLSL
jgi:hypothetical protein